MKMISSLLMATTFCFCAASAMADLSDPKLLGEYVLVNADPQAEMKRAELVYNNDNELVVRVDRNDAEYKLRQPGADHIIYQGEDEPNCGGDEEVCTFDAQTTIRLVTKGLRTAQMVIDIEVLNAWDESGKTYEHLTFILKWSKPLSHAIPAYLNADVPQDLQNLSRSCKQALEDLKYDADTGIIGVQDFCPHASAFSYQDSLDNALSELLENWVSKKDQGLVREISAAQAKSEIFQAARSLISRDRKNTGLKAAMLDQMNDLESYVQSHDRILVYPFLRSASLFLVNSKTKTIIHFSVPITSKYRN